MQEHFISAHDVATIQANLREIDKAIKNQAYIIIAQYKQYGKTLRPIRDAVKDYPYQSYCYANKNDKSDAIMSAIVRVNAITPVIYITGVNTDACVISTVTGLSQRYKKEIVVYHDACNAYSSDQHHWALKEMIKHENVVCSDVSKQILERKTESLCFNTNK